MHNAASVQVAVKSTGCSSLAGRMSCSGHLTQPHATHAATVSTKGYQDSWQLRSATPEASQACKLPVGHAIGLLFASLLYRRMQLEGPACRYDSKRSTHAACQHRHGFPAAILRCLPAPSQPGLVRRRRQQRQLQLLLGRQRPEEGFDVLWPHLQRQQSWLQRYQQLWCIWCLLGKQPA